MALNTQMSNLAVNAEGDALITQLANGYIRIYDGTQATNADTALGAQVLLAELRFGATAAPATSAGVITFNAITSDASANATGTASWYRTLKSDGTSVVMDGTVGTSASNMIVATTAFVTAAVISISSWTHTIAKATSGS